MNEPIEETAPAPAAVLDKARSPLLGMALFLGVLTAAAVPGLWYSMQTLRQGQERIEHWWGRIAAVADRREALLADLARQVQQTGRRWEALDRWVAAAGVRRQADSRSQEQQALAAEAEAARAVREQAPGRAPLAERDIERLQNRLKEHEREQGRLRQLLNEQVATYNGHRRSVPTRWIGGLLGFPYEEGWSDPGP